MKRLTFLFPALLVISIQLQAQKQSNTKQPVLKNYSDSASYAIGLDIASNLIQNNLDSVLSSQNIALGIIDGMNKNNYKIHPDQAQIVAQGFFMKLQQQKREQDNKKYMSNIEKGKKFLEDNKKNPSVQVTPSGLQYIVIKEGKGPKPTANDQVTLHYEGTLIDGKVFDSSIQRGEPATFGVNQVIPGFSEAIMLMSVGSKYRVFIPQELAYGDRNAGSIEPYSTLIFDIEIIDIPTQTKSETTVQPSSKEVDAKSSETKKKK
jgi:FKBP-type peptidyl-prolyl cis-trans isomerase FklB